MGDFGYAWYKSKINGNPVNGSSEVEYRPISDNGGKSLIMRVGDGGSRLEWTGMSGKA